MLTTLMVLIVIACIGVLFTEGMWGNAIRLINVVTAALVSTSFFEPVADLMESFMPTYTFLCDFLALWAVFVVSMAVLRTATNAISKVKVRFHWLADRIGSVFFATWIGWVMVCFVMMSLHTAPLARNFLWGSFKTTNQGRMVFGLAPDRQWLAFTQKMSRGAFCRSATEEEWKQQKYVFDPRSEFMVKYATRRANLESYNRDHNALRVRPEMLKK